MSSLALFVVATLAVIAQIDVADSAGIDLNKILEFVQQQQRNSRLSNQRHLNQLKEATDSESDTEKEDYYSDIGNSDDSDGYLKLKKEKLIDLLDKAANKRLQNNNRNINRKGKPRYNQKNIVSRSKKRINSQRDSNIPSDILDQLLSEGIKNEERKVKSKGDYYPKKRLKPNPLIPKLTKQDIKNYADLYKGHTVKNYYYNPDEIKGLDDYSKVYIVLNPEAVQKSQHKNSLNELVSKVLALSSAPGKGQSKNRHYNDFFLNTNLLSRRYRPSNEDDGDDEGGFKKKGHGGVGGPTHTAIPYVKQRGDIYERDEN